MAVKRVLIVRHGETDYNLNGRWQGMLQTSLNERGRQQARGLAAYLRQHQVHAIYSSDLDRAHETARIIAEVYGLAVISDIRLREINVGIFEGLTNDEILELYPLELNRWDNDFSYSVPQGESRQQLQARMAEAWEDITASAEGDTVVLVSHGNAIRRLIQYLFAPELTAGRRIHNTSLTIVERDGTHWKLVEFAAVAHLAE